MLFLTLMKKWYLVVLFIVGIYHILPGQNTNYKTIDIGNLGVTINLTGTIGNPNVRNNPAEQPSMEYPLNSGIEHLFEGGLWIGASVNGQQRVSTTTVDAAYGYYPGGSGFEFTTLGPMEERSVLPSSEYFSANAVSHQDIIVRTTDSNSFVPGTSIKIPDHDFPLDAVVKLEAYAWNYSFADFFVILNYEITNNSNNRWDSVYLGFWTDLVVRNVNVTQDNGTAFYNKGAGGFIDSFDAIYVYEYDGDDIDYTQSYASLQYLGTEWRNLFLHPNNTSLLQDSGYQVKVNANFWNFRNFDGSIYGAPADDVQRMKKLKNGLSFPDPVLSGTASNKTQLLSFGPVPEMQPGESVTFTIALVAAKQLVYKTDDDASRAELYEHLNWSKRTYLGEDLNENGRLDKNEDLNENKQLDRYILPEPPRSPHVKFISSGNKVDIYWDNTSVYSIDPITKKHDFEGFRLYRSQLGDDLELSALSKAKLIATWDSAGNNVGYNNGFDIIKLPEPVTFDGDSISYTFHYSIDGLLNGWQYVFVLTAFDEGDKALQLEPLESSTIENAFSVVVGTPGTDNPEVKIGVYPNPYRINAAWDGVTSRTKKLYFYNLPKRCDIIIYTVSGDVVAKLYHDGDFYQGDDIQWYNRYSAAGNRVFPGGEHAWDLLSENKQSITQGLYLFTVKDLDSGMIKKGKFAILK